MDQATIDTDSYRLRHFVERLIQSDELDVIDGATSLSALASHWVGNPKAVLFRDAGPEHSEIVANLMAGRGRLARAFDTTESDLLQTMLSRIATPQPVVEIDSADAPVHQVVWTGDDADFLRLPIPFQHALDGGPYLSSTIDITVNPETGLTNVGCRRMMITGRKEAGVDATAPSDLRAIYEGCARRGERLPISFVLGAHPTVHIAGTMRIPGDETEVIARLRGAPLPVVKCVTNDIRVPADAEMILEGYLDER
ncbi:MAG: 2,5-furandicarboxylate decarboxylase 1, partial [Alphaproteobacteria bacterium]